MSPEKDIPPRVEVLHEAAGLIDGDRNVTYGTPTQNFTNIAEMVTTRFRHKLRDGETITAADIADFMIIVKVARNIAQTKRDNYVDIAGYAGCGYEAHLSEPADHAACESVKGDGEGNEWCEHDQPTRVVARRVEEFDKSIKENPTQSFTINVHGDSDATAGVLREIARSAREGWQRY